MPSRWIPLGATSYLPGSVGDGDVRLEEANGTVRMLKLQPLAFRKALGEVFFQCVAALHPLALRGEKIRVGGIGLGHRLDVAPIESGHKRLVLFLQGFLVRGVGLVTRYRPLGKSQKDEDSRS